MPPICADESDEDMSSSRFGVAYESLTTWSWQLHLIDRRLDRRIVRDAIRDYHEGRLNGTALPASCPPSSEMDVLWRWTLGGSSQKRITAIGRRRRTERGRSGPRSRDQQRAISFAAWIHQSFSTRIGNPSWHRWLISHEGSSMLLVQKVGKTRRMKCKPL